MQLYRVFVILLITSSIDTTYSLIHQPQELSAMNSQNAEEHDYVIIGAGIGGLQAALILAEYQKDFVVLEASNVIGGRIGTETLKEIMEKQVYHSNSDLIQSEPKWLSQNPQLLNIPIEYGATWIAEDHQYMFNLLKMFNIEQFPQFKKGHNIYGSAPGKYQSFENHYNQTSKEQINDLLDRIQKLKNKFTKLYDQAIQKQYKDKYNEYKQFIDKYDTMSVKQFINGELTNSTLAAQVMNFIQCLQCIGCDKFSMLQLLNDDDSLSIAYEAGGDKSDGDDGYRVKTGMLSIVKAMANHLVKLVKKYRPEAELSDIIRFNEPVTKVQNWKNKNTKQCRTQVKGGSKTYTSRRVLNSIPLATLHKVNFPGISTGKQIIINGQEMGKVYRVYMIFEQPFWRSNFSGYGTFGPQFPFNEMTDISPAQDQCGILAFVCYVNKYDEWVKRTPSARQRLAFLKQVVADMFLKGDINSPYLEDVLTYARTFTYHPYIVAAYQPTTKMGVWKAVEDSGDQYNDSFERDENGVHFIGSQFDEEFGSYMQGALRITRRKVFQLISKSDPWNK